MSEKNQNSVTWLNLVRFGLVLVISIPVALLAPLLIPRFISEETWLKVRHAIRFLAGADELMAKTQNKHPASPA